MVLSRKQKACLWVGTVFFVLMGLFPPWYRSVGANTHYTYGFLLIPPGLEYRDADRDYYESHIAIREHRSELREPTTTYRLDVYRLCVQWIMVAVVTAGLVLTFHKDKRSP